MFTYKYEWPSITPSNKEKIERIKKIAEAVDKKALTDSNAVAIPVKTKIDYKAELNDRQFLAAVTVEGPVLVIAGAGSGKTRTTTYRASYLIESGVKPENILMLSFTRKAADEMTERLSKLISKENAKRVESSTFHSFAHKMLREYNHYTGLTDKFDILDTTDSLDLIDYVISKISGNPRGKKDLKKEDLLEIISKARNWGASLEETISKNFSQYLPYKEYIVEVANGYRSEKKQNNKLDFDDILIIFLNLLRKSSDFKADMHNRFLHIMVDEYQDTNIIQKDILDLLAEKNRNLMVVGDDAQAIYRFRGATMENILTFQEYYPECKVIKLEHNYRSIQPILDFTNPIMEDALIGYKKSLFSTRPGNDKPEVRVFISVEEEAAYIAEDILESHRKGLPYHENAVIYRSGFHNKQLQVELERRRVPYVVYGGQKFTDKKHVKDMICLLRILNNPQDRISWNRSLQLIEGIGQTISAKIADTVTNAENSYDFSSFENFTFYKGLKVFHHMVEGALHPDLTVPEKLGIVRGYYEGLIPEDEQYRISDIDILVNISKDYKSLSGFLNDFTLDPPSKDTEDGSVVLTTVHSSKGLEWGTVYLIRGLDGMFPFYKSLLDIEEIEEERRLFYVACTRAKDRLCICMPEMASTRMGLFDKPSRFIKGSNSFGYFDHTGDTKRASTHIGTNRKRFR